MINILKDVSTLTNVKEHVLTKIVSCVNYSIVDNVLEQKINDRDNVSFDIGIGILSIFFVDDTLQYYFKPSHELEEGLINAVNEGKNELELKLIHSINNHIYKTYKDML